MNTSRFDLDPSQMISRLEYTGQVERTNYIRREGNSHHAPDASHPTEAQNLPIARAAPQPIKTGVGLEILRDRLLAQRTAGQPVEERMHPRQTGREDPVTHEALPLQDVLRYFFILRVDQECRFTSPDVPFSIHGSRIEQGPDIVRCGEDTPE